jgi:serine protease Do
MTIIVCAVLAMSGAVCGGGAPPADARGQDPFDRVASIDELRDLERELRAVAERMRPTVVLLRLPGIRGGSTGSGVVLTADGLVATCGHVGGRAGRRVSATLSDGTVLSGRTLGQANIGALDCGLIQLDAEGRDLQAASLGTNRDLLPGDWVVAMGYTQGPPEEPRPPLVRIGRVLSLDDDELLFDAPIDAGDSGGPSFNLRGEVVAINSRCGRQSWENAATPIDRLRERMFQFRDGTDESMTILLPVEDAPENIRTHFAPGSSDDGRMAVQRVLPLDEIVAQARESMLRVMDGKASCAYATVIDGAGHAVTKRSQLPRAGVGESVELESADGRAFTARVVATDAAMDLAFLGIDHCTLPPIQWRTNQRLVPGQALLTPRLGKGTPALGFAAIESRQSERDPLSMPYLGVRTEPATKEERKAAQCEAALRVVEVVPDSGASAAGVALGDLILSIDGKELDGRSGLRRVIVEHAPGDVVRLAVLRGEQRLELDATLRLRSSSEGSQESRRGNTMTPISGVSSGFGEVLAHDAIVWPEQCGGPVLDLDGRAVGLNIARFDRTATHALGAKRVMKSAEKCLSKVK